eukprot:UN34175
MKMDDLRKSIKRAQDENSSLTKLLENKVAQISELNKRLLESKNLYENDVGKLKRENEKFEARTSELIHTVYKLRENENLLQKDLLDKDTKFKELLVDFEECNKKIDTLRAKSEELKVFNSDEARKARKITLNNLCKDFVDNSKYEQDESSPTEPATEETVSSPSFRTAK